MSAAPATVVTHGCRSNLAERDALASLAPPGATVLNSCAVTAQAVRQGLSAARAATGPLFITGCAATLEPARFAALGTVIPNTKKLLPGAWQRSDLPEPPAVTRQSRGFVAIQDGCDHACTFCVTTLARGRSRSVPVADLIARIAALVAADVREIVLTGIDATSYGADLGESGRHGPRLGDLVQAILARVPGLPRLRLSSLDAAEADPALVEAFADPRLMPHLHLSLQSGDDLVLKRMKRRHTRADALRLVARLNAVRPDIAIGADLIAGFPTEDDAAHARSLALIADCDIVHAHIFPYSERPGTAAARMPQLPPALRRARAETLRAAAGVRHNSRRSNMLQKPVETVSEGETGLSPHGFRLRFSSPRPKGALVRATPTHIHAGALAE